MSFAYDEAYRIKKTSIESGVEVTTWYVRDINGNLLAIYNATLQIEVPLYGASRVGVYNRQRGNYQYELKDHLGNVRVVINKTGSDNATIETTKDYYPFGLVLRQAGIGYRYGYQGDFSEEEKNGLNAFQLRYYDPVLGRWLTPDPMRQHWSPYLAMSNNPIMYTDPDGGCDDGVPCITEGVYSNPETGETVDVSTFDEGLSVEDFEYWFSGFSELSVAPERGADTYVMPGSTVTEDNIYNNFSIGNLFSWFMDGGNIYHVVGNQIVNNGVVSSDFAPMQGVMPDYASPGGGGVRVVKNVKNVKKVVVIGEDMANRVIPFAKKYGYKVFNPKSTNPANWMRNQVQWIRRQIKDPGTKIIDIGPKGVKPSSPYYKKELEMLQKWIGL